MRSIFALILIALTGACSSVPPEESEPMVNIVPESEVSIEQLNETLATMETSLVNQFIEICRDKEASLRRELDAAQKSARAARRESREMEKRCVTDTQPSKLVVGEIEDVELIDQGMTLEARIDTGAETSSLGVYRITKFERDGKDWVKFKLQASKNSPEYEYPVFDTVRIKLREEDATESRYEIKLDIKLGKKKYRNQLFNLSNRRHLDYQVLIGQSFLRDIAVVDVSTKHELKRN